MTDNNGNPKRSYEKPGDQPPKGHNLISYTVDGEPQETAEHTLTPRQIIINAGLNPAERYLVEIKGKHQESHKDSMDTPIHMHEHQKFVTVFMGPTPVA